MENKEHDIKEIVSRSCSFIDTALAECSGRETVSTSVITNTLLDLRIYLSAIKPATTIEDSANDDHS
jgi:hypothetical protein